MKKIYYVAVFTGILFSKSIKAQIHSKTIEFWNHEFKKTDTSGLYFTYNSLYFLKNNEYFNHIANGYTLFGSLQMPQFTYFANKNLQLKAGLLLRKDFGNDKLTILQPTFTLKYHKKDLSLIMGTLEGSVSHGLIEPLYNYERVILEPIENGIQGKLNKEKIKVDTWIDWARQQYTFSTYPEVLEAGTNVLYNFSKKSSSFQIKFPFQAMIYHEGGQLDTNYSRVIDYFDIASGVVAEWNNPDKNNFLQQIKSEDYLLYYSNGKNQVHDIFANGHGTFLNLSLKSKYNVSLLFSYWKGYHYIAPKGGYLYQSISQEGLLPFTVEPERKLLFFNLLYDKEVLPDFFFDVRFQPYYDLMHSKLEYAYGVFASYRKDFKLWPTKKRIRDRYQ